MCIRDRLEGAKNIEHGSFIGISSKNICEKLKAKEILILRYSSDIVDYVILAKEYLKDSFGGLIINWVPQNQAEYLNEIILPFFNKRNIKVFGSIFSDKTLSSVTIKEIAELIDGKIITATGNIDTLITSFMVGAMSEEQALSFFKKYFFERL